MFWFANGGLLLVMASGRASNISDLLTDIGREQARPGGWYEVRRSLQAWGSAQWQKSQSCCWS